MKSKISPLLSSPASPRGSSALSGYNGASSPALGPVVVGEACQDSAPSLGRDLPMPGVLELDDLYGPFQPKQFSFSVISVR